MSFYVANILCDKINAVWSITKRFQRQSVVPSGSELTSCITFTLSTSVAAENTATQRLLNARTVKTTAQMYNVQSKQRSVTSSLLSENMHRVWKTRRQTVVPIFARYNNWPISGSSFTGILNSELAVKRPLQILPRLKCVTTRDARWNISLWNV